MAENVDYTRPTLRQYFLGAGQPFAPNFVVFGDRTILNVPQGTPPVGDPSIFALSIEIPPGTNQPLTSKFV